MLSWIQQFDPIALAVQRARLRARTRAGLTRHETTLPDGRLIVYLDTGDASKPPLVLVHGIGASKDHWPRLAALLQDRFRLVIPDLPGFGESDKRDDADYSMAGQAEALRAFLGQLGLDRVHLAGSSMGGRIAAEYAHRYPDGLHTLWLLNPAGAEGEEPSEMIQGLFEGEGVPLFSRNAEEYAAAVAFSMKRPPSIPAPALRVLAAESAEAYDRNWRLFAQMSEEFAFGATTESLLRDLPIPTLVMWGQNDRVVHPSGADTIADAMPNATVRILPGVGHLPMLEHPEMAASDFLGFHDSLAPSRPTAKAA